MIRLVMYNASSGPDLAALAEVVVGLRPDVMVMTETPGRLGLARIARAAGLRVVERAGKGSTGVAILVNDRTRVLSTDIIPLDGPVGAPARSIAQAIVGVGAERFVTVGLQLGLREEVRLRNAQQVERHLATLDAPVVLAGDLNESPAGPVPTRFSEVLVDAFLSAGKGRGETYPNPDPTSRRDYVFVDRSLAVEQCWVPAATPIGIASRHRPIVVVLDDSTTAAQEE